MYKSNIICRYSRADLLSLRYEACAQQRPNCANQLELHTLNFWKINGLPSSTNVNNNSGNNTCYMIKSGLSPDRDRENVNLTSSNNLLSSRRALRNRERAHNYYQRFSSNEQSIEDSQTHTQLGLIPGNMSSSSTSYKTSSTIDQRSISSSHLMPAFAKRRFVTTSGGAGGSGNEASNESQVKENASMIIYSERALNPKDTNTDIKSHLRHPNNSLGSGSPVPNYSVEWERTEKESNSQRDHDKSLSVSPTFQSSRQQGAGINTPQERRIGSGRLLPRNDNWEKNASMVNLDNDRAHNESNSNPLRTLSSKLNDRSNNNLADRDRRREDGKKNAISGRRVFNKDKFNFIESPSPSMNRGKRGTHNLYHQSHDAHEPEWFSAGPTSQHETIDLHGFDDIIESEEQLPAVDSDPNDKSNKNINIETTKAKTFGSRSSSIVSLNQIESCKNDKKDLNETTTLNDLQSKHHNPIFKSGVEFNFDAFLNMDPMDHSIMSKEGEVHGQVTGTSRFTRWFSPNEPASNNKNISISDTSTLDTQAEIPSVQDLEAKMTKVDLRSEYLNVNPMTNTLKSMQTTEHPDEKHLPRDTEAFKRLLQQLGSQNIEQPVAEPSPYLINRVFKNDLNSPHAHNNDSMPLSQNMLQTPLIPSIHDPILSGPRNGPLTLQTQKRVDVQHLLQSVIRGDVSFEFLENELNNPNTTAQSREMIVAVLFEYTNSGRFAAQQKPQPLTFHNDANHPNAVKNYPIQHQQPMRHSNSPTPLAFTPTSVLRKMTADKETSSLYNSSNNNTINNQQQQYQQNYHQLPTSIAKLTNVHNMMNDSSVISAGINIQPRMILGGNYAMQNQNQLNVNVNNSQISPKILPQQMSQPRSHQTTKWPPGNIPSSHATKSYGRPILKGTLNSIQTSSNNDIQQLMNQQRHKSIQRTEAINTECVHGSGPPLLQNVYNDGISQQMQHQHYLQQQQQSRLRLMHGDLHCPTNVPINSSASIIAHDGGTDAKSLMNNRLSPLNYHRDDRLSPTTNQLAQWFSPELLARASAGKLPLLNMNQALSLEEFERNIQHSSATVLN
ncbi:hypothetical protein KR044_000571 [Drosophila immigrans]|nr:hypothetical protein KR044_000571 [Drosophila immigrans]